MGTKRTQRKGQEDAAHLATEDPAVAAMHKTAIKWSERLTLTGRKAQQVQHLLRLFTTQVEECTRELTDVYADAALLSALRLAEYRQKLNPAPPPPVVKKGRLSKRDSSARAVPKAPADENGTDALLAAMDEKRRHKVTAVLAALFKRPADAAPNTPVTPTPAEHGSAAQLLTPRSPPPIATPPANDGGGRQGALSVASEAVSVNAASVNAAERRPRDVPLELWEEMWKLRFRRLTLEERMAVLTRDMDAQVRRFELLVQNHAICSYTKEAVDQNIQAMKRHRNVVHFAT